MANVWNEGNISILSFTSRQITVVINLRGQAIVRNTTRAQPEFGIQNKHPQSAQLWPRPEIPQRDKLGVV